MRGKVRGCDRYLMMMSSGICLVEEETEKFSGSSEIDGKVLYV